MSDLAFGVGLALVTIAVLLLAAWLERKARGRVQAIKAYDVTPDAVRYLMTRGEDR